MSEQRSVWTRFKELVIPTSFNPKTWPPGFIAAIIITSLTTLGLIFGPMINKKAEKAEVLRVKENMSDWMEESLGKIRYIRWGDNVGKDVRSGAWAFDALWNKPFFKKYGVSPRIRLYKPGVDMRNGAIVDVVSWKGDHCNNPTEHFGDLPRGKNGATWEIRLCVAKAYELARAASYIPGQKKGGTQYFVRRWYNESPAKLWGCVMGHEIGHTWMYKTHPSGTGLMAKGGGYCEVGPVFWKHVKANVVPSFLKSSLGLPYVSFWPKL